MIKSREELVAALGTFERAIPALVDVVDPATLGAVAHIAESIFDSAGPDDQDFVRERINGLLGSAGLVASENEDDPCG